MKTLNMIGRTVGRLAAWLWLRMPVTRLRMLREVTAVKADAFVRERQVRERHKVGPERITIEVPFCRVPDNDPYPISVAVPVLTERQGIALRDLIAGLNGKWSASKLTPAPAARAIRWLLDQIADQMEKAS